MATEPPFIAHVLELARPLGPVSARKMFGGWGIYCEGLMFGLVADEVLYLKADDGTRPRFEAEGSGPFTYQARGKRVALSYWRAPVEAMDAPHLMQPWARLAMEAALRAARVPAAQRASRAPARRRKSARSM